MGEGEEDVSLSAGDIADTNSAVDNTVVCFDGLIVIGGGISTAWELFAPAMFEAIQRKHQLSNGNIVDRTTIQVFNIENEQEKQSFLKGAMSEVRLSSKYSIAYDTMPRTAVIRSTNGASKSISIGAYYFAISQLNS